MEDLRKRIEDIRNLSRNLTKWEQDFLDNLDEVLDKGWKLSPNQLDRLEQLEEKG